MVVHVYQINDTTSQENVTLKTEISVYSIVKLSIGLLLVALHRVPVFCYLDFD